jgi:heme oxygenase
LRLATGSRHDLLDTSMPLAAPDATLTDYAAHLHLLLAWLTPIETWLAAFTDGPQQASVLPPADRTTLMKQDLAEPGMPPAPAAPPANWQPERSDPAYRWGVCYVIEGAQLGGAVLHRRLAARLHAHPLRYLRGAAEQGPGPRWQQFIRQMRTQVATQDETASACLGACRAFDSLLALRAAVAEINDTGA